MIGIAICTHSDFAKGLKNAIEMIAGEQQDFLDFCFFGDEQLMEYGERIKEGTNQFESCIYVTDLVNATPFNASLIAIAGTENVVLTGASLPLVLELVIRRQGYENKAEDLAREIVESSKEYVELKCSKDIFGE
ncbi:PTS sugar transporter subunit IIA [Anaerorhabdus sp.]|uniref:PTS sugar transporter subunit IIA n=1 Tax=Anaerorhabdus sp. TaxID=1872524 RepID=UPI002FC93642